jgi:hypothetical protein
MTGESCAYSITDDGTCPTNMCSNPVNTACFKNCSAKQINDLIDETCVDSSDDLDPDTISEYAVYYFKTYEKEVISYIKKKLINPYLWVFWVIISMLIVIILLLIKGLRII